MDPSSAPALLYAAKKYLLSNLTQLCSTYLQGILNTDNIYEILELSFTFDVKDLKTQCLGFVGNNSETVLNGNKLLTLSRQSFETILKLDRIMSGPSTVFQSCVKWAKHQLKSQQSVEDPTDLQVREALGSLLYDVRFPTISAADFANLAGESDVLTAEEKSAIYFYIASKRGQDKLKFSSVNVQEYLVTRATKTAKGLWPGSQCPSCGSVKSSSDEINFKTDKNILLTGLGLYTGYKGAKYDVGIAVKQDQVFLLQQKFTVSCRESSKVFKVAFDKPVSIAPGKTYKIICLAYEAIGYFGEACVESVTVANVTFKISSVLQNLSYIYRCVKCGCLSHATSKASCSQCGGKQLTQICMDENSGQIPQLYFIQS